MENHSSSSENTKKITRFWDDLKSGHFASMIKESSKGNALSNAQEVCNIMKPFFARHDDIEKMYCILLDAKNTSLLSKRCFLAQSQVPQYTPEKL